MASDAVPPVAVIIYVKKHLENAVLL